MSTLVEERKEIILPPPPPVDDGGGDDDSGDSGSTFPISKGTIATWILLTAILMLFAGLSSAYIVLRGMPAWQSIELPWMLWPNSAVLLMSSLAIELSRKAIKRGDVSSMKRWLAMGGLLGLGFVAGQLVAWKQLINEGVYLPSTLQSSFFYILTGLHGLHLLGGIIGLCVVLTWALKNRLTVSNNEPLKLIAMYWHVMDGLWVYLFLLMLLS